MEKKVVFSGVQPSGNLTLGNYIGAIKNWIELQDEYDCNFSVVNLHAITVPQLPAELRKNTLSVLALYLAAGLDPKKCNIFIQSHVPEHLELSWILSSISYMGQLGRMTQYKEKSRKSEENLNAALFTYPVLMAADILLYGANLVPVGEDQKQHMELARDLAERFNNKYSETFVVPEALIKEDGARVMSLQEPNKKMSKSDDNENGYILILDDRETIIRKIKRAVTDSEGVIRYSDDQPGVKNLLNIYSVLTGQEIEAIVKKYEGKGYGDFKGDLAEIVADYLEPIRLRYNEIIKDKDYLEEVYREGAQRASYKARKILSKVQRKVGFIPVSSK